VRFFIARLDLVENLGVFVVAQELLCVWQNWLAVLKTPRLTWETMVPVIEFLFLELFLDSPQSLQNDTPALSLRKRLKFGLTRCHTL
jgi:hypothetical protein